MAFWQLIVEGEKYVAGSLVPMAIYTFRQSFLQVIASVGCDHIVKKLIKIIFNDLDRCYDPTTERQLKYSRDVAVGHGNCYTAIHPCFYGFFP